MAGEWGLLRNWLHSWPGALRQDKHLHNHQGRALKYPVENYWRVERLVYPGTSSILFYLPGSLAAWVGPAFLLKHDSSVSICQGWSSGIKRQKFDFSGLQTLNCDHSHLCPVWHPERSPAWGAGRRTRKYQKDHAVSTCPLTPRQLQATLEWDGATLLVQSLH